MTSMYANLSPRMRLKKNRVPGRGERLLSAGGASSTTVAAAKTARLAKRLEKCISSPLDSSTAQILDERHLASLEILAAAPKVRLHSYQPQEVAEELCLMDAELLRKIGPKELENGAWMKQDKDQLAPNVLAMVRASNNLAKLVPSEVLAKTSIQAMAKVIASFIKIAIWCHRLHNFNSLKALLAGLQCTPIYRLQKTWKEVPAKHRKKFEVLCQLMSEEMNYHKYRQGLDDVIAANTPCIPFLGVLLTTIVQFSSLSCRGPLGSRRCSGIEDYTVMEAVTVRNRLERLRRKSSVKFPHSRHTSVASSSMQNTANETCADITTSQVGVAILEGEANSIDLLSPVEEDGTSEGVGGGSSSTLKEESSRLESEEEEFRQRSKCIGVGVGLGGRPHEECGSVRMSNLEKTDSNLFDASLDQNTAPLYNDNGGVSPFTQQSNRDSSAAEHNTSHSRRRRRNGVSENALQAKKDGMAATANLEEDSSVPSSNNGREISSVSSSVSIGSSSSSTSYESALSTLSFSDPQLDLPSPVEKRHHMPPKMTRCASDQKMDIPLTIPPSIHNSSISMECIRDVLEADPFDMVAGEVCDISVSPDLSFRRRIPLFPPPSPMTDEGIFPGETEEDTDSNFSSPDLVTPPPVTPELKFSQTLALESANSLSDRHTWSPGKFPIVSKLNKHEVDSKLKPLPGCEPEEDDGNGEDVPAEGPSRKRSRARASRVLIMALAPSMQVKDWAQILARYQMLSLGCSNGITSRHGLRSLILNYSLNSDSANYKLSHDREPSH